MIRALAARVAAAGPRHRRRRRSSPTPGHASRRTRPAFPAGSRSRTRRALRSPSRRSRSRGSTARCRLRRAGRTGADLVFLIAAPEGAAEAHLAVLSKLARSLMQDDFTSGLRAATSADEVVAIVRDAIGEGDAAPAAAAAPAGAPAAAAAAPRLPPQPPTASHVDGRPARIVAVTACATGIAHTFMAADALTAAGKKAGIDLRRRAAGLERLPGAAAAASSTTPTRSSSRPTSTCASRSASPASRWCARACKRGIEQPDRDDPRGRRRGERPERPHVSAAPRRRPRRPQRRSSRGGRASSGSCSPASAT